MGVLDPSSKESTINYIHQRTVNRINEDFVKKMVSKVMNKQEITFSNGVDSGVSQESAINGVMKFVAEEDVSSSILTQQQWAVQQKLYNDSNTIGALGSVVKDTSLSIGQILDTLLGKVVVGVVALLVVIVIAISGIAIYKAVKKN